MVAAEPEDGSDSLDGQNEIRCSFVFRELCFDHSGFRNRSKELVEASKIHSI